MSGGSWQIVSAAIVNLILISIIFSLLTIRFRSIWAACGLHTLWNYILYNILGLNLSGIVIAAVMRRCRKKGNG